MNITREKSLLRASMRSKLVAASPKELEDASMLIVAALEELPELKSARYIASYVPLPREPNILPFLRHVVEEKGRLIVPVTRFSNHVLGEIHSFDELIQTPRGLKEPAPECFRAFLPEKVEVMLVPGLAFDVRGMRLGRGQGFFDKILARASKCVAVGVAFDFQIVRHVPCEEHDMPVHKLVTEKRIISCVGHREGTRGTF
jgi:5-formyltetrahydrofolate cyclo-ligase